MKRIALFVVLAAFSSALSAGVTYQFKSVTDGKGGALDGTAFVEGSRVRLDFRSGDGMVFQKGTIVLSDDGGKTMRILDPKNKTYYEFSLEEMVASLGGIVKGMGGLFKMDISNPDVKVADGGDGGTIEGYPTKKYLVDSSYDMNMTVMGMKRAMKISTRSESWTTDKLAGELMTFVQHRGLRTGIEDLDKLIAAQGAATKGFLLKQVSTTTTTQGGKAATSVTTTTVSNIETAPIPASRFEMPAGYRQGEAPFAAIPKM
ncbi:MAG TPA: DUF4412 domain-containing protein [Thermoanaerobaculia bacterium]|nr:DUF4412 domain-containing protein [Thermoanaerobaculia bacterium]